MTDDPNRPTFERDVTVDDPGIIGARWWNRALSDQAAAVSRRDAMKSLGILAGVGAVALGGVCVAGVIAGSDDTEERNERALDAQRRYGWNLGARDTRLLFPVETLREPFDTRALAQDLAPVAWRHVYQPTLLEAPDATPTANFSEETVPFHPLRDELVAGVTDKARQALSIGMALARIFSGRDARAALVVDLPGPEAVALAAGAATVFEPVLLAGNWPHPKGVVPSHLTLATALKCHANFHAAKSQRPAAAPPCFVLERERLQESVGDDRFDNRYLAAMPSVATLRAAGIARVLYIVPTDTYLPELDDLNEDFVAYQQAGIEVRALAASAFHPAFDGSYVYGNDPSIEAGFWLRYPWSEPGPGAQEPFIDTYTRDYRPIARATRFDRRRAPPGFGTVALVVSGAVVLGAAFDRRGSWHRASGGWSGG